MRKPSVWTAAIGVIACTIVGVCGPRIVRAQSAVTIDVADCVKLTSPGDRLNCYERQVDAAAAQKAAQPAAPAPAPATQAVPPRPAPAAAAATPAAAAPAAVVAPVAASGAGSSSPPIASAGKSAEQSKAPPPDITATITDLRVTVPNSYRITLDNGQVWQQTYPESYALQKGQRVTLRASKWGTAYRLSAEGLNGFIQVQRVR